MKKQVVIEKIVHGGYGLARTDQGVLFVPYVLPEETVNVVDDGTRGGQRFARPIAVAAPSSHRRSPMCEYFGICGGCDLLHADYEIQLSSKRNIFLECLQRIGKIERLPECEVIPSPELGYRQRAQLKVDMAEKRIGFYKYNSRAVVGIKNCPLLVQPLNSLLAKSKYLLPLLPPETGQIKCIAGSMGAVASLPAVPGHTFAETEMRVGAYRFLVSGDAFFQGNAYLCEKLGMWGRGYVNGNYLADLYGGVGFFSILLHDRFKAGTIVDTIGPQIELARKNLCNNGITHIRARNDQAHLFLDRSDAAGLRIDCIIVDPPRAGLTKQVREAMVRCRPATILSVSCNPSTQARDVGFFCRCAKYKIEATALFDLYPNTHHMETIVVLRL